jgi:aminomuconate-semialdehyde/2-hydroxymuconate-6-semialdehyde dehydrogenase
VKRGPWGKLTQAQRSKMVRAIADGVMKRFDDFLEAEVLDTGKKYSVAYHVDTRAADPTSPRSPM